jgi:hypothetical protein
MSEEKHCAKCGKGRTDCRCSKFEEETDTVAAGTVRSIFGDEAAKGFKDFFWRLVLRERALINEDTSQATVFLSRRGIEI